MKKILKKFAIGVLLTSITISANNLSDEKLKNHKTCNQDGKPTKISFYDMKNHYPTIFKGMNRKGSYLFTNEKGRLVLYAEISDSKQSMKTKMLLEKSPNGSCYYAVRMKGVQKGKKYDIRRSENSKALNQVSNSILLTVNAKNEKGLLRQIRNLEDDF